MTILIVFGLFSFLPSIQTQKFCSGRVPWVPVNMSSVAFFRRYALLILSLAIMTVCIFYSIATTIDAAQNTATNVLKATESSMQEIPDDAMPHGEWYWKHTPGV